MKNQFYPGNDSKYNKVYSSIINHFKFKPNDGCYVCLCKKGFYHCVKAGFPNYKHLNRRCPKYSKPIGPYKEGIVGFKIEKIVKRDNYFIIFRDEKEIEEIKKDIDKREKLNEINYMTLEEYKKKYIYNEFEKEKGIFTNNDKNCLICFKSDQKIIRNLSQASFRILNYILYSHLFFARLITNRDNDFDVYLPKGMTWLKTLSQCWDLLKNELLKENIDSIEKFM